LGKVRGPDSGDKEIKSGLMGREKKGGRTLVDGLANQILRKKSVG